VALTIQDARLCLSVAVQNLVRAGTALGDSYNGVILRDIRDSMSKGQIVRRERASKNRGN
jgi:hypothetical protein